MDTHLRWTKRPHRLARVLIAALGGLSLAFGVTGYAHADPTPAELEAQIDKKWNEVEPIIEQHNQLKAELNNNKAKQKQLQDQILPLQLQVDNALTRVSAFSVMQFKAGRASSFNALLTTGSPDTFAEQLMLLNMLAKDEQARIKDVLAAKKTYDDQKRPLDALIAQQVEQEAAMAQKEQQINAEIKALNEMRARAYGSGNGTGVLKPVACPMEYAGGPGAKAAQTACNQIGKPYIWAAEGPNSFDCSGLTLYAWKAAGHTLRHYTKWQYQDTKRVSRADLKPGDLVFYYSDLHHVGMYVGGGWIVHAPTSGDKVRMKKIDDGPISGYGRVA
ncbi:C40 family peptidase [Dactylosporangium roseum]|uniref:C40 family peptidase n=1 Tax=Dactylosporangium roseum TaxID=47989 RepID=A0ABY5Z709_9ACTN|nr:C40 family peptidase [Dactylosporangium roseum]UWZ36838.1 C40 family peptidase [Dactylosporangium roseum]